MAALFADGNNSRSSFDFLMQTAEASAAKAQQVLKPFSSPAVKDSGRPEHTATEGSGPGPAEAEGANGKARRSVIMQNKRLNRYNPKAATTGTPIGTPSKQTATPSTTPTKSTAPNSAASPPRMGTTEKKLDEYGFITNMDRNGTVYDDVMNSEKIPTFAASQLNEKREKKWAAMIASWDVSVRRRNLTSRRLRKGVPNSMRGKVWALLGHVPSKIKANPGKYDMMVQQSLEASSSSVIPTDVSAMIANNGKNVEESRTSLANSKTFRATQETIERDIHRTYPRHGMFHDDATRQDVALDHNGDADVAKMMAAFQGEHPRVKELLKATGGQASLRRVLRAYSVHDLDVGYCQGMNFIAGMFLTFMTEEESFWLLVGTSLYL
jgi:Rab-GTPase-TBC domain